MSTKEPIGDRPTIEMRIRDYLAENFLLGGELRIDSTTSLLGAGVLDSTGVLELITFIEQEFGVQVADDEMVPENLDTIASLADFVLRKSAAAIPATSSKREVTLS